MTKSIADKMVEAFGGLVEDYEKKEPHRVKVPVHIKLPSGIEFAPITIRIDEIRSDCDHDWLTWTGLHGTITDCTKCREVKK